MYVEVIMYSKIDELTGLFNRQAIQQALDEALARARQEDDCLSVLTVDVTQMKQIIAEHGQHASNEVIRLLGTILAACFHFDPARADAGSPNTGIAGRLRGDTFLVILPGRRADWACCAAEKLRSLIEEIELTISLGVPGRAERKTALRLGISSRVTSLPGDASQAVNLLRLAYVE